ncbi:hypothetical protein [Undibacterium sp. TJN19]|uniref:hypothetical protein n=1 Tax=Undibacterium sp. TJN19 TaxID=3413055 RepID=UPI003BF05043
MPPPDRKVKFDGTINLGHLLTFLGFIVTGATAWMTLNTRVIVLEEARTTQHQIDLRQDTAIDNNQKTVREDLKEINQKLDRLIERKP